MTFQGGGGGGGGDKIRIANVATLQRLDFFGFDQRCDVDIQCHDVTEKVKLKKN